jgi:hypothetical protein
MDKKSKDEALKLLKDLHHEELQEIEIYFKDRGRDYDTYEFGDLTEDESCVWEDGFLAGVRRAIEYIETRSGEQTKQ